MARASEGRTADGSRLIHFRCPGCDDFHQITVGTWTFNDDLERPTFTPSVLTGGVQWDTELYPHFQKRKDRHPNVAVGDRIVCHSFVTDGRIQFLGDCTHVLAGQTVDLPEWEVTS
jgi:hypothetical protein